MKLGVVLAIPASNEWKILIDNSAEEEFMIEGLHRVLHFRKVLQLKPEQYLVFFLES